jgi:hypothetical protein
MKALLLVLLTIPAFAGEHMFHEPPDIQKSESDASVTTRPAMPKVVAPASMTTVDGANLILSWEPVEGADFYNVQLARDPGFFFNVIDERFYKDTKISTSNLQPGTHYFWRVAAGNSHNASSYNKGPYALLSFTTGGTAPAP